MDAAKTMAGLRAIDEYHLQDTILHRRHPSAHVAVTLVFICTVLSFGKYEISGLVCYIFYPMPVILLGDIPFGGIGKRVLAAMPFILLVGIFNPFLDTSRIVWGGVSFSAGWLSMVSLVMKGILTVSAALLLIGLTGMGGIARALRTLHVPRALVAQLSFTYRYMYVLGEEIVRILTAYRLRAPGRRGVSVKNFGSLSGNLLLRSIQRADHIYDAMRCRGFRGDMPELRARRFGWTDALYTAGWTALFVVLRMVHIPAALGRLMMGM